MKYCGLVKTVYESQWGLLTGGRQASGKALNRIEDYLKEGSGRVCLNVTES